MQLPEWLDNLIFEQLNAEFCPSYSNMTNIDDDKVKTLNYLGTYFPRSYVEAYSIFKEYFLSDHSVFESKEELSIFDFGCGTGGEIIGMLTALCECYPQLKKVSINALDGNADALRIFEKVLSEFRSHVGFQIEAKPTQLEIDDFYDLSILNHVMTKQYDIIMSFKAICEFVSKERFEQQNPYEHIARFLSEKLNEHGLLLLEDITVRSEVSNEWLPMMMDKGLKAANCSIVKCNRDYNQEYIITHSRKHNDVSKVAWRMIKK